MQNRKAAPSTTYLSAAQPANLTDSQNPMILFQAQIEEHQKLAEHYRQLAANREALAAGLLSFQQQADSDLSSLRLLVDKCKEVAPNAIVQLKSAVLTLFDNNDNGSDGGNLPTDPTPEPDGERGQVTIGSEQLDEECLTESSTCDEGQVALGSEQLNEDEPELLCLNGVTGEYLTTSELEESETSALPTNGEAVDSGSRDANAVPCAVCGADLSDEANYPEYTAAALAGVCRSCEAEAIEAEKAAQIEPVPQPQKSSTEMVHLGANVGYLRLKADGRILATYCWFARKNIAQAWLSQIEVIPAVKTELRESKRNFSWKWELKISGLSMAQIERLASEPLHQNPRKFKETPAQAAGIEPPSGWRQPQLPETQVTACAPKKARITLESSPYCGHVCDVVGANDNWWTLATPKGNLKYPADSVESVDEAVQMAESEQETEAIAFEFGDVVEVVADLNDTHLIGSFGKVKFVENNRVAIEVDEQIVFFQPSELSIKAKAELPSEQLRSGQVLLGDRIVTNGNYIGAARRTAANLTPNSLPSTMVRNFQR